MKKVDIFRKFLAVFYNFRLKNKPQNAATGQNLQELDQRIDLAGRLFLYDDVQCPFEAAEATFSAPKISIFLGQISAIFGTFFSRGISYSFAQNDLPMSR